MTYAYCLSSHESEVQASWTVPTSSSGSPKAAVKSWPHWGALLELRVLLEVDSDFLAEYSFLNEVPISCWLLARNSSQLLEPPAVLRHMTSMDILQHECLLFPGHQQCFWFPILSGCEIRRSYIMSPRHKGCYRGNISTEDYVRPWGLT